MTNLLEDIFLLNLKDYSNIGVDFYINIFLLVLFVCIGVGCFVFNGYRNAMHILIKQLVRHGAKSESEAKTLKALGLSSSYLVKRCLSGNGQISRIVRRVGEKTYTYEEYVKLERRGELKAERIDFSTAAFYLDKEKQDRTKYILENYSSSLPKTILLVIFLIILYICISFVMPEILSFINSSLAS